MQDDLKGIPAAQNYWQAYFDKYTFEHEVLATAEDSKNRAAFVFWLDRVSHYLHVHDTVREPEGIQTNMHALNHVCQKAA